MIDGSPTLRQRELGKRLRDLRKERGLTVEDVGKKLLCSAAKISRLETGRAARTLATSGICAGSTTSTNPPRLR